MEICGAPLTARGKIPALLCREALVICGGPAWLA
jgi:hypothetical protein